MADPVSRAFARSLLRLRTARGWSQARLSRESGVSAPAISKIEAYGQGCRLSVAALIAGALGTGIDAMIAEDDLREARHG